VINECGEGKRRTEKKEKTNNRGDKPGLNNNGVQVGPGGVKPRGNWNNVVNGGCNQRLHLGDEQGSRLDGKKRNRMMNVQSRAMSGKRIHTVGFHGTVESNAERRV